MSEQTLNMLKKLSPKKEHSLAFRCFIGAAAIVLLTVSVHILVFTAIEKHSEIRNLPEWYQLLAGLSVDALYPLFIVSLASIIKRVFRIPVHRLERKVFKFTYLCLGLIAASRISMYVGLYVFFMALFAAGDPQGERALRTAIGDYLHSARGVDCRPEQILIGAGSEYLLMLLSQILGNGRKIAMENPTYKQAYRVLKGEGYPVIPVDMDRYGMDVQRLSRSSADVAYVMPSHQYPTGIVMPVKRRQELLAWAYSGADRYLIEDDYDSEFRYKGKPIPALQGMDRGGRVIYMGTFSKSIAPAIRVGFMVLPEHLLEAYRERAGF